MASLLWRHRSDVLVCLLIQCLILAIGMSLQTFENHQTMANPRKDFALDQR
jgi:hypothetical protein